MIFLSRFLENKLVRFFLLFGLCIITAISFVTYSEFDPSFNSSTDNEPINFFSYFGSYYADILVQLYGFWTYFLIFSILVLAVNVARSSYHIDDVSRKVFINYLSCVFFGVATCLFDPELAPNALKIFSQINVKFTRDFHIPASICIFSVGLVLYFYGMGTHFRDYLYLLHKLYEKFQRRKIEQEKKAKIMPKARSMPRDNTISTPNPKQIYKEEQDLFIRRNNDGFEMPPIDLLSSNKEKDIKQQSQQELEEQAEELLQVLNEFGIKGNIVAVNQGPVVTLYEFEPAAGTKSSRVISLADDIARSLCAVSARIAVIPGRNALGIELPNKQRAFFRLRELFESDAYKDTNMQLPIVLGKDISGRATVVDLAKMPHLLVAGTTGSGKSVAVNAMIVSLLYKHSPAECKFIMIDPKMLELSVYDGIPHLLAPVVTEPGKAVVALKWAVKEMENRYRLMSNVGVRNIYGYNEKIKEAVAKEQQLTRTVQTGFDTETGRPIFETMPVEMTNLPFIVIIVDEMADLMLVAGKDIESSIQRLAQMARAAGIHLIMATQRPSVDVITGVIKANFPSRVSFKVTSKIDSRTILGEQGAEQLLGMGDMLYMGSSSRITRVHGPFVEDSEVERISQFLKEQESPQYINSVTTSDDDEDDMSALVSDDESDDGLYKKALQIVKSERKASTSYIQRCLRIGYNRAAILVERMEKEGIVSPPNHSGKREILLPD